MTHSIEADTIIYPSDLPETALHQSYRRGYKKSRRIKIEIAAEDFDLITSELDRAGISLGDFASGAIVRTFAEALEGWRRQASEQQLRLRSTTADEKNESSEASKYP